MLNTNCYVDDIKIHYDNKYLKCKTKSKDTEINEESLKGIIANKILNNIKITENLYKGCDANDLYMNKVNRLRQSENLTIQWEKIINGKKNNKRIGLTQKELIDKNCNSININNNNNYNKNNLNKTNDSNRNYKKLMSKSNNNSKNNLRMPKEFEYSNKIMNKDNSIDKNNYYYNNDNNNILRNNPVKKHELNLINSNKKNLLEDNINFNQHKNDLTSKSDKIKEVSNTKSIDKEKLYNMKIENAIKKLLEIKNLHDNNMENTTEIECNKLENKRKDKYDNYDINNIENEKYNNKIKDNSFPKLSNRKKYIPSTINLHVDKNQYKNKNYLISNMLINNEKQNSRKIILASNKYCERVPSKKNNKIIYSNHKKSSINTNNSHKYNPQYYSYSNINTKYPYIN